VIARGRVLPSGRRSRGDHNGRIRELPTVVWAVRQMGPREVNMCRAGQGVRHAERHCAAGGVNTTGETVIRDELL
jgi:hypothetical protein